MAKFRILSIDGGGLRGIVPLRILREIEVLTGKSIRDSFDLIAGTSTGGIIACALTASKPNGDFFELNEVEDLYASKSSTIFPKGVRQRARNIASLFWGPRFNSSGLTKVLNEFGFDRIRLDSCSTPLFIPAYDLKYNRPVYFKSRDILEGSSSFSRHRNASLTDICKATSAAPTYLKPHQFQFALERSEDTRPFVGVDGGVFLNNPTLAAYLEVLSHRTEPPYNSPNLKAEDIFVLSLGTGSFSENFSAKTMATKGKASWARPVIDIMMMANSHWVDNAARRLLGKKHYLRLSPDFTKPNDMANSSPKIRTEIVEAVESQIINNNVMVRQLIRFLENAELM